MVKGSTLTAKQLRNAAPIEQLPFELKRKYASAIGAEPVYYKTIADVRKAIVNDLKKIRKDYGHFLTEGDRSCIDALETRAQTLNLDPESRVVGLSNVVDTYSGVKYEVTVERR